MKIKIMDDFVHEYEDVTQGKVYEVVEECLMDYVIIDDQFDRNAILKEHCEIVELKEDSVKDFKVGDRVKINGNNMDKLKHWGIKHKVNSTGIVEGCDEVRCIVLTDDDNLEWFVPGECLESIEDVVKDDHTAHTEEPTKSLDSISTLCNLSNENKGSFPQQILNFTREMKGFEVSFEEGKVTVKDWNNNYDCIEYVLDSIDDLEPMMESISHIQSFKKK